MKAGRAKVALASALAIGISLAGCTDGATPGAPTMILRSAAFAEGESIPSQYTCDGADISPPLAWDAVPDGTGAFALIADDPDARGFVHWVLTDIPPDARELPEGEGDQHGTPGRTDFGQTGWGGPCPPSGEHGYAFTLYALSELLGLGGSPTADQVRGAMSGRVLGEAQLTGAYTRSR